MKLITTSLQFCFALLIFFAGAAQANLIIEISDGYENASPIGIIEFSGEDAVTHKVSQIIKHNLRRSGRFAPLETGALPETPQHFETVAFSKWRAKDVDYILQGKIESNEAGGFDLQVRLVDILREKIALARSWKKVNARSLRQVAHQISDVVFYELTGIPGAFNTRLAYVTVKEKQDARQYTLEIADSDGYNPQPILRSSMPIMSPSWSPDGEKLAYVSFESGRSNVLVQNLVSGKREIVAEFQGINSAPSWSPDGKSLVLTLSKDGNADIYVMNMQNKKLTKVTRHWAIETEASWAPDGKVIYFNSDRRGQPQIFKTNLSTKEVSRVSFEGRYNANPVVSPNGRYLAMVHAGKGFNIGLIDLYNGGFSVLTNSFLSESPSFAPNSDMLVYSMNKDGAGQLAVVAVDGRASQVLRVENGQVREPAWGPYIVKPSELR